MNSPIPSEPFDTNRRLKQTQNQVNEVVDIMRVNVDKVLERDEKLHDLNNRAEGLKVGAAHFESSARMIKRKYWWKNCKMWAILIGIGVVIIIIIIVSAVSGKSSSSPTPSIAPSLGV